MNQQLVAVDTERADRAPSVASSLPVGGGGGRSAPATPAKAGVRQTNVGRLLLLSYRQFERLAMANLKEMGFADLRMTHLQILPYVPAEGIRTTEIAALANMTKQAVGQLAAELEDAGYVTRFVDPADGRAKLLGFTRKGRKLLAVLPTVVSRSEKAFEDIVGKREFGPLKHNLRKLAYMRDKADREQ